MNKATRKTLKTQRIAVNKQRKDTIKHRNRNNILYVLKQAKAAGWSSETLPAVSGFRGILS